jgi:hypothetical protein
MIDRATKAGSTRIDRHVPRRALTRSVILQHYSLSIRLFCQVRAVRGCNSLTGLYEKLINVKADVAAGCATQEW